jgi:hypothetical protein
MVATKLATKSNVKLLGIRLLVVSLTPRSRLVRQNAEFGHRSGWSVAKVSSPLGHAAYGMMKASVASC